MGEGVVLGVRALGEGARVGWFDILGNRCGRLHREEKKKALPCWSTLGPLV